MKAAPPKANDVAAPALWRRSSTVAGASAVLFVIVLFAYVGAAWPIALHAMLTDGLLSLIWVAAAYGAGSLILALLRPPSQPSPLLHVTRAGLGLGAMSLIVLGLGLAGLLNRATAYGLLAVGLAGCVIAYRRRELEQAPAEVSPWQWMWLAAMPFLGLAVVAALVPPGFLWPDDPHGYDVVEYHLQIPREWYEAGRITPLTHNVFSFFPFNVEMHYLLAMHVRGGPWAGMYLAQLMHVWFIVLTVLALWAAAGPLAAVAAATVPWLPMLGSVAYNEGGLLLFGTLAIAWAMRALGAEPGRARAMAIAGAMAGLACGAKYTAVIVVAGAIVVAALFVLRKRSLVPLTVFGAAAALTFSPWLIRNGVWAGNPVFPEAMPLLGRAHFSAEQVERWQVAHSPTEQEQALSARLSRARDRILLDWRYGYLLLPTGLVAAGLAWRAGRQRALFLLILLIVHLVFWLSLTHLQSRFFVLGVPILALLIGEVTLRGSRLAVLILVLVAAGIGFARVHSTLEGTPGLTVIGLEDFSPLMTVDRQAIPPGGQLLLAGDVKAFWYQVPMTQLRYRTVFDVNAKPGQSVIDAWIAGWPAGQPILVSPQELVRFHRTYRHIPAPPPDVASRRETYLVR